MTITINIICKLLDFDTLLQVYLFFMGENCPPDRFTLMIRPGHVGHGPVGWKKKAGPVPWCPIMLKWTYQTFSISINK